MSDGGLRDDPRVSVVVSDPELRLVFFGRVESSIRSVELPSRNHESSIRDLELPIPRLESPIQHYESLF